MPDKLWKTAERSLARILGGKREPVSGRQRGDKPDIAHSVFSVEVKHRESLPAWIMVAMKQADAANNGSQISMVLLHEKWQKYEDTLTIMRLSDTLALYQKIEKLENELSNVRIAEIVRAGLGGK